jgi:uncharacterized protein (DUF952 family)
MDNNTNVPAIVYHVTMPDYWEQFVAKTAYVAPTFEEEGFIHCCIESQMEYVLTTYFRGVPKLVLLEIATEKLTATLRMEAANGQVFPHIYGAINKTAIIKVKPLNLT